MPRFRITVNKLCPRYRDMFEKRCTCWPPSGFSYAYHAVGDTPVARKIPIKILGVSDENAGGCLLIQQDTLSFSSFVFMLLYGLMGLVVSIAAVDLTRKCNVGDQLKVMWSRFSLGLHTLVLLIGLFLSARNVAWRRLYSLFGYSWYTWYVDQEH